jgi:hypothetical protein
MALIITPTPSQKIHIQGTSIELSSVYTRIEFGCRPNGKTIEIAFYTYADKTAYQAESYLPTDLPVGNTTRDIDLETQTQSVETAHELAKEWFEEQGYEVVVDL